MMACCNLGLPNDQRIVRMKKAFSFAALMAVWTILATSAVWAQKYDVEISVESKKIVDLTPLGLSLVFHLDLKNESSGPRFLAKYDYRVVIDETEYLNLQTALEEPIRIEPRSGTLIALPIKITYGYLFQVVPDIGTKDKVACFLTGGITFQDEKKKETRVPIAFSGDFPLYSGLDVRLLPVEAKALTVGGADIVCRFALMNPNGFSLSIEWLTYKLDLAGKTLSEGTVGRGAGVESRGEKIFDVPLLLDFFEVDKAVSDGLAQPPVAMRVSGEIEINTPWGNFKYPLDKSDKVAVQKIS